MKVPSILLIGLILTAIGCCKKECDEALTISNFKVGTIYCLDDNQSISIDSIQDSRCPLGVLCIWPGQTQLNMKFYDNGIGTSFDIVVPNDDSIFVVKNKFGYDYSIKSISPYPMTNVEEKQSDYVVEMRISKEK